MDRNGLDGEFQGLNDKGIKDLSLLLPIFPIEKARDSAAVGDF